MIFDLANAMQAGAVGTTRGVILACGQCNHCIDGSGEEHCKHPDVRGVVMAQINGHVVDCEDGQIYLNPEDVEDAKVAEYLQQFEAIVLWVSRHEMSQEQKEDFYIEIQKAHAGKFSAPAPRKVTFKQVNLVLPADGPQAVEYLIQQAKWHGASWISGVFPANVAVAVTRRRERHCDIPFMGRLPVAVPAAAVEGQARAYNHSHFEPF